MTTRNETTTTIINDHVNVDETVHAAPKIVFIVPYRDREHHLKFFQCI